ncbi:MAG TPA: acyl-ACP--UDP-N-acetylglucosamine O-acyltransferase [Syntrophales bacterium]|nr:acyl-ACP--UDP-N-acetylglucosamine O-acyltransferase [Syntrophales bacterium]HOX93665.1 acyl-ACP--UDP-N-acetylglucosamine O-acyltransferase [Syntrophales bacterium]HPI57373.1 acyl-ACP--UDP-N-acetylglucosamine O-acyltransferase [Syntrophales bacterium]HPN25437.1 acyl-ACP--UDP-N-acetylglucosamine O-acyltransferase [Syntrophales bacterium]HQM29919.1 acyl-ACP--UDP-N-acetylglucosamine O-acyltransferase [Syntrophales bacterium]
MMNIHPAAIVDPGAQLSEGVQIGPYTVIHSDVTIGKNTVIGPHVIIDSHTDIGADCRIFQFSSIGAAPQDLKYRGEETRVIIGDRNVIREFVTINRSTTADIGMTKIGNDNLIMAYSHVAHNCRLGNFIVMANAANLAGHIDVEDFAIIGGLSGVHQFTRIGTHAFIGGASAVAQDVPPYVTVSGNRARLYGLNVVGLKRRGFSEETLKALRQTYKIIFRSALTLKKAVAIVRAEVPDLPEVRHMVEFIEGSERGVCR